LRIASFSFTLADDEMLMILYNTYIMRQFQALITQEGKYFVAKNLDI